VETVCASTFSGHCAYKWQLAMVCTSTSSGQWHCWRQQNIPAGHNNAIVGTMPLLQQPQITTITHLKRTLTTMKKKAGPKKGQGAARLTRSKKKVTATAPTRKSKRQGTTTSNEEAQECHIDNGVLFVDKTRDGLEETRKQGSLQVLAKLTGSMVYDILPREPKILDKVNHRRRASTAGKDLH
jgi:hypothetical protein